jgi:DNA-binding LacI/PurR family transcriptional regulator
VFAASDLLAVGAAQTLAAQGRRIPQDVALAGFDDSGLAEAHTPPLTTIRQPWAQISATMVEMVLEAIAGTSGCRRAADHARRPRKRLRSAPTHRRLDVTRGSRRVARN